jgi:hypothetical protein
MREYQRVFEYGRIFVYVGYNPMWVLLRLVLLQSFLDKKTFTIFGLHILGFYIQIDCILDDWVISFRKRDRSGWPKCKACGSNLVISGTGSYCAECNHEVFVKGEE